MALIFVGSRLPPQGFRRYPNEATTGCGIRTLILFAPHPGRGSGSLDARITTGFAGEKKVEMFSSYAGRIGISPAILGVGRGADAVGAVGAVGAFGAFGAIGASGSGASSDFAVDGAADWVASAGCLACLSGLAGLVSTLTAILAIILVSHRLFADAAPHDSHHGYQIHLAHREYNLIADLLRSGLRSFGSIDTADVAIAVVVVVGGINGSGSASVAADHADRIIRIAAEDQSA